MHFGENQLSPGSIGISPLPTAHPIDFATLKVRASIRDLLRTSPWPWVDHPVSGLLHATERPIQTRFRSGSASHLA